MSLSCIDMRELLRISFFVWRSQPFGCLTYNAYDRIQLGFYYKVCRSDATVHGYLTLWFVLLRIWRAFKLLFKGFCFNCFDCILKLIRVVSLNCIRGLLFLYLRLAGRWVIYYFSHHWCSVFPAIKSRLYNLGGFLWFISYFTVIVIIPNWVQCCNSVVYIYR